MIITTSMKTLKLVTISLVFVIGMGLSANAQVETGEDIVDSAQQFGQIHYFHTLLQDTGLDEKLREDGPYTVLAPTTQAFQEVPEDVMEELLEDADKMRELLLAHVFEGTVRAEEFAGMDNITSVDGTEFVVSHTEQGISVDGAMLVAANIIATNGVIHAIEEVLLP